MEIWLKIKGRRTELGLTLKEVAKALGVSESTVQRYETSEIRNMGIDKVEALARVLKVAPEYLMGWTDEKEDFSRYGLTPANLHKIPLLGSVACGKPVFADQDIETYVDAGNVGADFALHCKGDSMIGAGIYDGDIAYIRRQPTLQSGEIGVVLIGEDATLKRFYKYPDQIQLHAENPAYPALVFRESDEITILGKLVGFYHEVRESKQ